MHEITLVTGLFEIINEQVAAQGITSISKVRLKVGELAAVEPMTLAACFEVVAEGTVAQGAQLEIVEVPLAGRCRGCGERFRIVNFSFSCPACGGEDVDLVGGRELYLESLDATCRPISCAPANRRHASEDAVVSAPLPQEGGGREGGSDAALPLPDPPPPGAGTWTGGGKTMSNLDMQRRPHEATT
ncbi:hydrogenase maturation nickel metallochaperone HypA [Geomonas azotofigens]|uniref:hydrogenase maturation nickel metallochaperone HypA n=1 Tax=Geomonas azotofigens TaxID=2843196 RepID=UPI001F18589E|nr:hydrogenase maturation nickel metallochaperone HypA [Geomonas azotofigens]